MGNSINITEYLKENYNFKNVYNPVNISSKSTTDYNLFTCVIRIHELHYLFYSEENKYFTIGLKYTQPKGLAGGGLKNWNLMMVPKVIYTIEDADNFLKGLGVLKQVVR